LKAIEEFQKRQKLHQEKASEFAKKHKLYSALRAITFLIFLVVVTYFANERSVYGIVITSTVFVVVFGSLLNAHIKIRKIRDRHESLTQINADEELRFMGELKKFDEGKEYLSSDHPFARDMDVFGRNSVFQLLNRTTTNKGRDQLASWLLTAYEKQHILQRQVAVKELQNELDWRQNFQASGLLRKSERNNKKSIIEWIKKPNIVQKTTLTMVLAYLLPVMIITSVILYLTIGLSFYITVFFAVVNALCLKKYSLYINDIVDDTNDGYSLLTSYKNLIENLELRSFQSPYLLELKSVFELDGEVASKSINKLKKLLDFINGRANAFYLFFNVLLMFDLHLLMNIEKWKTKHQAYVERWFDSIGKFEALASMAGYAYANDDYCMPEIYNEDFKFESESMGHPLIHYKERVTNDFEIKGVGNIALITGSNMSGKSTFLRTVGVNMVLAYSGAPVCAKGMSLSIFQLFTSMRTEDNLEENISSFYAELKKIEQLLHLLNKQSRPIFFMLDEILKGTNSRDRHAGAEALIKQLAKKPAMGFVSTHDLELGKLSDDLNGLKNYSFNSRIEEDKILFNYKLEDGLCRSFNASKLMQQIGIKI